MYTINRIETSRHRQNAWLVHLTSAGKTARRMAEEERIRMVLAVENGQDPALRRRQAVQLHRKFSTDDTSD
ncbi:hypothetical protein [Allorhizobium taibaishanense]|uniref:Uncharacterized protein n=1 Tax=Allorhizobium taibaishanense TaxID=887144 RepID=A0A7W6MWU2_9HYPH|nr:hypothetical protein [Allorhizobium taibaishanense]MBB4010563.1 hypothetical protein [Allorhizobium taibaishanense]